MDFESVLAMLGDNYKGVELFTVENRDIIRIKKMPFGMPKHCGRPLTRTTGNTGKSVCIAVKSSIKSNRAAIGF